MLKTERNSQPKFCHFPNINKDSEQPNDFKSNESKWKFVSFILSIYQQGSSTYLNKILDILAYFYSAMIIHTALLPQAKDRKVTSSTEGSWLLEVGITRHPIIYYINTLILQQHCTICQVLQNHTSIYHIVSTVIRVKLCQQD